MAQVWPQFDDSVALHGGALRERDVIERLQLGLPSDYCVIHSVGWHSVHDGADRFGEIDVIVIAPTGSVLLLEVKAGQLQVENGELLKHYGGRSRNVIRQMHTQFAATKARLQRAGLDAYLANALVIPDYVVGAQQVLGIDPGRIIDVTRYDQLATVVRTILQGHLSRSDARSIQRFFLNQFDLHPDLRIMGEQARTAARRMAGGLAAWVPRIHSRSGLYRVQGTAGSGKTQLALALLDQQRVEGLPTLYVCFNRTLADHIAAMAPPDVQVSNFHELCMDHYRRHVSDPDFSDAGLFQRAEQSYCQAVQSNAALMERFGLVVIDEAQDFDPAWVQCLLQQLHPAGRFYLLEDESQRLYQREAFELDGEVTVVSNDNYRTPRAICDVINALQLGTQPVAAKSAVQGQVPTFHTYVGSQTGNVQDATVKAVQALCDQGIALDDIVVLSWHGLKSSSILQCDHLGPHALKRFTGQFNKAGDPVWTHGELMAESVYRFKGQSAAGVVLTEVDFADLTDPVRRKLFVAMTRPHLAMEIVLSEQAAACLAGVL